MFKLDIINHSSTYELDLLLKLLDRH